MTSARTRVASSALSLVALAACASPLQSQRVLSIVSEGCVGLVVGVVAGTKSEVARAPAQSDVYLIDGDLTVREITRTGRAFNPAVSANGGLVAYLQNDGRIEADAPVAPHELWISDTSVAGVARLLVQGDTLRGMSLAPRGTRIAVVSDVDLVPAGAPRPPVPQSSAEIKAGVRSGDLYIVDSATASAARLVGYEGPKGVTATAWAPETETVAFTTSEFSQGAYKAHLLTRELGSGSEPAMVAELPLNISVLSLDWSSDGLSLLTQFIGDEGVKAVTVDLATGIMTELENSADLISLQFGATTRNFVGLTGSSRRQAPVAMAGIDGVEVTAALELGLSTAQKLAVADCALGEGR